MMCPELLFVLSDNNKYSGIFKLKQLLKQPT